MLHFFELAEKVRTDPTLAPFMKRERAGLVGMELRGMQIKWDIEDALVRSKQIALRTDGA